MQTMQRLSMLHMIWFMPQKLSYQFPKQQNVGEDVGAKVIGYSNISSSLIGAAYSATSQKAEDRKTDNTWNGKRYYTDDDTKASLTYDVVETDKLSNVKLPRSEVYGGKYSYLGINAMEYSTDIAYSFVDTFAIYDIRDIKNPGEFIEFTLSLSRSDSYLHPVAGNPHSSGTARDITKYIQNIKIYGKDVITGTGDDAVTTKDVLYDMTKDKIINPYGSGNSRANTLTASLNESKTMLTIRVHKSLLRKQGSDDSLIYMVPISYEVITGNEKFNNTKTGDVITGLQYSNYKVSVTAATYETLSSTDTNYTQSSYAYDHLIYTNTRIDANVIE